MPASHIAPQICAIQAMLPQREQTLLGKLKLSVCMPGDDLLVAVTTGWRGESTGGAYRLLTWRRHRAGKLLCASAVCLQEARGSLWRF
jgi:hypothetical protein